jgi:hypothetical protein
MKCTFNHYYRGNGTAVISFVHPFTHYQIPIGTAHLHDNGGVTFVPDQERITMDAEIFRCLADKLDELGKTSAIDVAAGEELDKIAGRKLRGKMDDNDFRDAISNMRSDP